MKKDGRGFDTLDDYEKLYTVLDGRFNLGDLYNVIEEQIDGRAK